MSTHAEIVKSYMARHKLSQADLAARLGVTRGLIQHWVKGRQPVSLEKSIQLQEITGGALRVIDFYPRLDVRVIDA